MDLEADAWTPEQLAALEKQEMAKILLSNVLPAKLFYPTPRPEGPDRPETP